MLQISRHSNEFFNEAKRRQKILFLILLVSERLSMVIISFVAVSFMCDQGLKGYVCLIRCFEFHPIKHHPSSNSLLSTPMSTYWRKYGILKFKINLNWLYSYSLLAEETPCSSKDKEQPKINVVLTGPGKLCIMILYFVPFKNN